MSIDFDRYSRNIALFGELGQQKISDLLIAIVGLGGLGAHVVQQTAYLGVRRFILVDDDTVTTSNLNRLVGATEADAHQNAKKVFVAERIVRSIQESPNVITFATTFADDAAKAVLQQADLLFGCVDNDAARLALTDFAAIHHKPYIDLASDTGEDVGLWYGGRVFFTFDGRKCLSCSGELDQRQISRSAMTPQQRIEDDATYGVPMKALKGTGPAVISINGVVASLGVTEFMVWATGMRKPHSHLSYRGDLGRVTINTDNPPPGCYYCSHYRF